MYLLLAFLAAAGSVSIVERPDGSALFAKTGWASGTTPPMIGWWVGWVEREGRVYPFALNIDMASADDTARRLTIGRSLLTVLGVLRP
jgi:beta-lactamase class D